MSDIAGEPAPMGEPSDLPPEEPFVGEEAEAAALEAGEEVDGGLLDRLRGTGVGVEDPNIVGDVGPTDIPPGSDGGGGLVVTPEEEVSEN